MYNLVRFVYIGTDTHTPIIVSEMPPHRMGTRGRPRVVEAQAEDENQPQLATAVEIAKSRRPETEKMN